MGHLTQDVEISLTAMVPYALGTAPSQRFRIEQWAPYLEKAGIGVSFRCFADQELTRIIRRQGRPLRKSLLVLKALGRQIRWSQQVQKGQIVFLHRAACLLGPPLVERSLHRKGCSIVYDFDDAIYLAHSSDANRAFERLKQPGKTTAICRMSRHVVAGNSHLAFWARQHNARVSVVPSSIDTAQCIPRDRADLRTRLVVGWMGSSTSQTYLESFSPMLRELRRSRDLELRVVSDRRPRLEGVPATWRAWAAESEADELAEFDIGIMPLPNEEWALGKCALKALQYMSMAVPTVASDVGANRDVIQHGVSGLLATDDADWVACIAALADDPGLRMRLGEEGRRTVEARYSMRTSSSALASVLRSVDVSTRRR